MSDEKYEGKIFNYFITIYDPRQDEKIKHKTRKGKAPENLALLRRLAINVVKKDQERYNPKKSLKSKRYMPFPRFAGH